MTFGGTVTHTGIEGVTVAAGGNSADTLTVNGTTGNDAFTADTDSVEWATNAVGYSGVESLVVDGGNGTDALTVTSGDGATLTSAGNRAAPA